MDGMAGVNILSDRHALSPMTLALLEDSGWYTVNWESAVRKRLNQRSLTEAQCLGFVGVGQRCRMFVCRGFL